LKSITLPNSVTFIGNAAFVNCSSLSSVAIPNDVTYIGIAAFANCSSLTSVTIPNGVTVISDWTFQGCCGLTSVTIPNSVTDINYYAFEGCGFTSVTIGSSVKIINGIAFSNCNNLETVKCLAEDVPWADIMAFQNSNLQHATLYVPAASLNDYKTKAPWNHFGSIRAIDDLTGVTEMPVQGQGAPYYTLDGRRMTGSPKKGIYIQNGKKILRP
jgi:hypothetical protein